VIDRDLILIIVNQAIAAAFANLEAFMRIVGRPPTIEEWQSLQTSWKSPDQIAAEVRAKFAAEQGST